jgi:very-short-patch-repair endonuclease
MQINWWEFMKNVFSIFINFWYIWLLLIVVSVGRFFLEWLNSKIDNSNFGQKSRIRKFNNNPQPTPEALRLGNLLKDYGWKVEFEKWDGYKHIDIAITEVKVNIEVDGKQHGFSSRQALADLKRTFYSFRKGYVTLRIPNILVRNNTSIEETAAFINEFLKTSDSQLIQES